MQLIRSLHQKTMVDFDRIKNAITYIHENYKSQPSLDEIADHVHLSQYHFQRLFSEWAGVSPKKFLQFVSLGNAKKLLIGQQTLLSTSYETGLSGTSRLHDLFLNIEGMTPGSFKSGGEGLEIEYAVYPSAFGEVLIASTSAGICHISFLDNEVPLEVLKSHFPEAHLIYQINEKHQEALKPIAGDWSDLSKIKLHLKGTPFQLKVWEALLKIPFGKAATYSSIASYIDRPKAMRAVGSAVGANPVAYLIPCHRVIQSTGAIGQYHWGSERKTAMLGYESLQEIGETIE